MMMMIYFTMHIKDLMHQVVVIILRQHIIEAFTYFFQGAISIIWIKKNVVVAYYSCTSNECFH